MLIANVIPSARPKLYAVFGVATVIMYATVMVKFPIIEADLGFAWIRTIFDCT
jgi:hypothetical protein